MVMKWPFPFIIKLDDLGFLWICEWNCTSENNRVVLEGYMCVRVQEALIHQWGQWVMSVCRSVWWWKCQNDHASWIIREQIKHLIITAWLKIPVSDHSSSTLVMGSWHHSTSLCSASVFSGWCPILRCDRVVKERVEQRMSFEKSPNETQWRSNMDDENLAGPMSYDKCGVG